MAEFQISDNTGKFILVGSVFNQFHMSQKYDEKIPDYTQDEMLQQMWDNKYDIHEVYPNLFLSNRNTAENIEIIEEKGINVIICITNGGRSGDVITKYAQMGIDYYSYSLSDVPNSNIKPIADIVVKIIDHYLSLGKKVLVHCEMGISRSVSLVIAYIMQKESKSFEESLHHVRKTRKIANPNIGFISQLK